MIDYRLLVYLADTIGILLMIMVLVFGRRGRIGKDALPRADRLFHTTVYMNLGLCALDFPVFFLEGLDTPYTKDALYAVNTIQAVLLTSMTYVWLLYVLERTQFKTRRSHRLLRPIVIPLIGNIVIYMINFFVPVVYYISDDFHYTPDGVLYPLVLAVDFIYFVGSSIYGLIAMHHSKNYQFFPFIFVLIFTTAGSIIQALVYQASVIYLATSLAITAIFMESQNEKSYIDSLSRVFNRQYLNRYVTRLCSDSHSDQTFLMADIDSFKNINDTYGHQAGDQAIRDMGSILLEAAPVGTICARYGGDEFVVILQTVDSAEVQKFTAEFDDLRSHLNDSGTRPYGLHVSFGSTVLQPGDTPDSIFHRMDKAMYEQKRLRHSRYDRDIRRTGSGC